MLTRASFQKMLEEERHVFAALTIKGATSQYGAEVTDGAVVEELKNLIKKEVFEFVSQSSAVNTAIPSKMILTPKNPTW